MTLGTDSKVAAPTCHKTHYGRINEAGRAHGSVRVACTDALCINIIIILGHEEIKFAECIAGTLMSGAVIQKTKSLTLDKCEVDIAGRLRKTVF